MLFPASTAKFVHTRGRPLKIITRRLKCGFPTARPIHSAAARLPTFKPIAQLSRGGPRKKRDLDAATS